MFSTRLYGALPRVRALVLFAIVVLALPAHAEGRDPVRLAAGPQFSQSRVAEIVRAKAESLGVPVDLALAITRYESGGRCDMRGRAGERGAMQVLPQTARSVGIGGNLYDCATGIEARLRYLKLAVAMHAYAGWCAVASAYNSRTWHGSRCTGYGRAIALAAGLR
jgi:soluble lytic murein transglycosylase-like protein